MSLKKKTNQVLYRYNNKIHSGYGVNLLRFYLIEDEVEELLKSELRECYKDVKGIDGNYSEEEFRAWFNYKYKQ